MAYTPLEQKLHGDMLLYQPITALVGTNIFGVDLPQGIMSATAPVRALTVLRVSTLRGSLQERGIHSLASVRIQFTAWCKGTSSEADALAVLAAIAGFLNVFDATAAPAGFTFPPGRQYQSPNPGPNFILNERVTRYATTLPPLYMGILDARIMNREDL